MSATCDETLSWMIKSWMENDLVSDSNCNIVFLIWHLFEWTLIFEWYVIRRGSNNIFKKKTCVKTRLDYMFKKNTIIIINSIVNIIGVGVYNI